MKQSTRVNIMVLVCMLTPFWRMLFAQCHQGLLFASDQEDGSKFGRSIDITSTQLMVGSSAPEYPGGPHGKVYVHDYVAGSWVPSQELIGSDQSASSGVYAWALAAEDSYCMVSSLGHRHQVGNQEYWGSVYVYEKQGDIWVETQELFDGNLDTSSGFGVAVALSGTRALVGAPGTVTDAGKGHLFERLNGTWTEVAVLRPSLASPGDDVGFAVALEGDVAVITAQEEREYELGSDWRGAAYVFERQGDGSWIETARLRSPDPNESDLSPRKFGWSVSLNQGRLLIGYYFGGDQAAPRRADLFEKVSGVWQWSASLEPIPDHDEEWGQVELEGNRAVVAGGKGEQPLSNAVYVFDYQGGQWVQIANVPLSGRILTPTSNSLDLIAMRDGRIAVGSPNDSQAGLNRGVVYTFDLPPLATPYCLGNPCPCGNEDPIAGCGNSTGRGSLLAACGTTSAAADDLVLETTHLPANQFGIFFMGAGQVQFPFGDGLQCVGAGGAGIFRYSPPQSSGPGGLLVLGPGIVARSQSFAPAGRIGAGQSWNFQTWYRDPMGSACGMLFNLSNAVAVTFSN